MKVNDIDLPKYIKSFQQDIADANKRIQDSLELKEYLKNHPEYSNIDIIKQIEGAGLKMGQFLKMNNFMKTLHRLKYIAVLNKNQPLYPDKLMG